MRPSASQIEDAPVGVAVEAAEREGGVERGLDVAVERAEGRVHDRLEILLGLVEDGVALLLGVAVVERERRLEAAGREP